MQLYIGSAANLRREHVSGNRIEQPDEVQSETRIVLLVTVGVEP